MSNFLKQGNRKGYKVERKRLKKHGIQFYKILDEMNTLATDILLDDLNANADNIQELAVKHYGRELDSMEKTLVLSKIDNFNELTTDKTNE